MTWTALTDLLARNLLMVLAIALCSFLREPKEA